jgi:uncharacterized NAD(P)/FAD-binding protein YdhS
VAVIGAGASGTLATIYLLRAAAAARTPLRVALIDRWGKHGLGRAYATAHPAHLLNSPTDRMSAVVDDPGHLTRWAAANGIKPDDGFLSRPDFGRYLRELLADAERTAGPAATVARITSDVVGLTDSGPGRPLRLHLAPGGHLDADAAVLATGNASPAAPFPMPASPRYIGDPWVPGALDGVSDGSPAVVLGTGLTMLDVAISLTGAHPQTVVYAVSRHGLVPREHRVPSDGAAYPPALQRAGRRRRRPRTAGRPWSTPCARTFPDCGNGCRCQKSACSCARWPATGRCIATACRPRPPGPSTSSGPRAGSRCNAAESSRSPRRRRACASG